jgi:PRTRC genetic system protein B
MFAGSEVVERNLRITPVEPVTGEFALCFSKLFTGDYVVSHHAIKNGLLQAGKPVDPATALAAVKGVVSKNETSHWVLPQIAYESDRLLVWHRPASKVAERLWFRGHGEAVVEVRAKLPSLVFILDKYNRRLAIFSKLAKGLPTAKTALYHAPLCNINGAGGLCVGTATMPEMSDPNDKIISMCEAAITDTLFTHPNHKATFKADESVGLKEHIAIWKEIALTGKAPNAKHLVPAKVNLGSIIAKLEC